MRERLSIAYPSVANSWPAGVQKVDSSPSNFLNNSSTVRLRVDVYSWSAYRVNRSHQKRYPVGDLCA